jgi:hypothetical protein
VVFISARNRSAPIRAASSGRQHLDGHLAIVPEVIGQVHGRHAAVSQLPLDAVGGQRVMSRVAGRWSSVVVVVRCQSELLLSSILIFTVRLSALSALSACPPCPPVRLVRHSALLTLH